MDIVGRWIDEWCHKVDDAVVKTATLHKSYERFCRDEVGFSMSAIAFARELTDRGFERVKVEGSRGFRGLYPMEPW
jgi:hypothetical protein